MRLHLDAAQAADVHDAVAAADVGALPRLHQLAQTLLAGADGLSQSRLFFPSTALLLLLQQQQSRMEPQRNAPQISWERAKYTRQVCDKDALRK